jgi:hypothetical protein
MYDSNYMQAAMQPALDKQKEEVYQETFGHLAPKKNIVYRGKITFALGCYDSGDLNPTILSANLASKKYGELSDSPWFYEAVTDFLADEVFDSTIWDKEENEWKRKLHAGNVYQFEGFFRNYKFVGIITNVYCAV